MRKFGFLSCLAVGIAATLASLSQKSQSADRLEKPTSDVSSQQTSPTPAELPGCESCGETNFVNLQSTYWSCPIFPLYADFFGAIYYCDRYETPDCSDFPQADFIWGDYNWPYAGCGAPHCKDVSTLQENEASPYPGLPNYVAENYLHTWNDKNTTLAGQTFGESCIPGGPAKRSCKVSKDYDNHFLKAKFQDQLVYAKILQFRFSRKIALGKLNADDPAKDPSAETFYVAFQTAESYGKPVAALDVVERGPHAFHCMAEVSPGNTHRVLVLLKKSAEPK